MERNIYYGERKTTWTRGFNTCDYIHISHMSAHAVYLAARPDCLLIVVVDEHRHY